MAKVTPTLLLTAAILVSPVVPAALAMSTEDAPAASDGSSAVADPDELIDQFSDPNGDTDGGAAIEVPTINMPGDDSSDYMPPDSEEDSSDGTTSQQSD